jgi:hypothetical protein
MTWIETTLPLVSFLFLVFFIFFVSFVCHFLFPCSLFVASRLSPFPSFVPYGFRLPTFILPSLPHHSRLWSCPPKETCQLTLLRARVHFAKLNGVVLNLVLKLGWYRSPTWSLRSVTIIWNAWSMTQRTSARWWWLVSFGLPLGKRLGTVQSRQSTFGCPPRLPSLTASHHSKIFLFCVAGYLPREQTASVGGGIRHGTTTGRQPGIAGA